MPDVMYVIYVKYVIYDIFDMYGALTYTICISLEVKLISGDVIRY